MFLLAIQIMFKINPFPTVYVGYLNVGVFFVIIMNVIKQSSKIMPLQEHHITDISLCFLAIQLLLKCVMVVYKDWNTIIKN